MSTKRLFLGVRLPQNVMDLLATVQQAAGTRDTEHALRWVRPENLHVTLHFLGDTDEEIIPEVVAAMDTAVGAVSPARTTLGRAGTFPSARRPRVLWVGVQDETGLLAGVHRALSDPLLELGFELDSRPYHQHITVGYARKRARRAAVVRAFTGFLAAAQEELTEPLPEIPVQKVDLVESRLSSRGPTYTTIAETRLS